MPTTDYQSLFIQAVDYAGLPNISQAQLLKLALLRQIAATLVPAMPTDYQSLISSANVPGYAAAGLACDIGVLLELALLQIIAANVGSGGGGTGATFGNYAAGQPNFTPSGGTGIAVDTSNGTEWFYYNGAWH